MERISTASIKIALGLFAVLFAAGVYRAATCDVTPAEAWNYDRYIGVPWQESLRHFDINNHFLNTLLVRVSTRRFHLTELSLRLPGLLGGLMYLWVAFRLCRKAFGDGPRMLAAFGVMTLNPLVVDALGEARGYGFAMAFWLWGLLLLLECSQEFSARKVNRAALFLALSVAACLSFIVPVVGLAAAFAWVTRRRLARDLYLPLLVFLFVLLAIPLNRLLLSDFAHGAASFSQTLAELTAYSFGGLPGNPLMVAAVVRFGVAVLIATAAILGLRRCGRDPLLALTAGTALFGATFLWLMHLALKAPFPQLGGIYFIPILSLTGLALVQRWPRVAVVLPAFCIVLYAAQFRLGPYLEGRESAGSREIAKAIRADAKQRQVRIAVEPPLEPVMNYYRTRYRQGNWERIETKAPAAGYDYYVLTGSGTAQRLHLTVLRRERGLLLAQPAPR